VYFRYNEKESVMVVLNNNEKEQNIDLKHFASLKRIFKRKRHHFRQRIFITKQLDHSRKNIDGY
jgi:hypothetical protein